MPSLAEVSNARLRAKGKPMGSLSFGDVGNLATPAANIRSSKRYAPPSSISSRTPSSTGSRPVPRGRLPKDSPKPSLSAGYRGGYGLGAGRLDQMRESARE